MTSDEMTTGSVSGTPAQRQMYAERSRWWNSTGGGTGTRSASGVVSMQKGVGAIKAGDGGAKFRAEWPELDKENWTWMEEHSVDVKTGERGADPNKPDCAPVVAALARRGSASGAGAIGEAVRGGRVAGEVGQSWIKRNKLLVGGAVIFVYVLIARLLGQSSEKA